MSRVAAFTSTPVTWDASKKSAFSTSKPPPTPTIATRGRATEVAWYADA
jgi:hypothetical protein